MGLVLLTALLVGMLGGGAIAEEADSEPITVLGLVDARQLRQIGDYIEVDIRNWDYLPGDLEVKPGTVVVWLQSDPEPHNVHFFTGDDNPLESGVQGPLLRRGQRWAVVMNEPGFYEYMCDPHPFMYGFVHVKDD